MRKAQLEDGALLRDIVADQRVNPVTHGLPRGLTERNAYGMAIADMIAEEQRAALARQAQLQ